MNLIRSLEGKKNFTEVEIRIADYILEYRDNIASMSITDLAQATYTSNPAIIRLCKKLGIDGYRNFRIAFASELERQHYDTSNIDYNYPFSSHESASSIMKTVAILSKEALSTCFASLDSASVYAAARCLNDADKIYIFALGDTYISAQSFSNMLVKLGVHCVMANQFHESVSIAYGATSKDVALFISYSGCVLNKFSNDLAILRNRQCKTILVSSLPDTDEVDLLINFPSKERSTEKVAGYYSQTCIHYVLNVLYGLIFSFNSEKNLQWKNQAENLARNPDVRE